MSVPMSVDDIPSLFDRAVRDKHDYKTQLAFAQALARKCDWSGQTGWFDRLAAAIPDSEAAALAFIETCCRAGMGNPPRPTALPAYGVAALERVLRDAPASEHRSLIRSHLAYLHNELGNFAAAEQQARLSNGSNAIYHFWLAEALYEQRKFVDDPACAINLSTLRVEHFQRLVNRLQAERVDTPYASRGTVYQFSGDAVYFRRFVVPQTLSLARFGRPFHIHFHVFDPDAGTIPLVERLRTALPHFRFGLTTETVERDDIHSKRSYYAFARYMRAYDRFREGHDVVVADADLLFRADPQTLLDQAAGCDAGIVRFEGQPLANRYNASFVLFRQSFFAELLLSTLDLFLRSHLDRSLIWILDQISLYCCMQRLGEVTGQRFKLHIWPEETICIHQLDSSPIWNGATNRKWTDSPYNRLRHALLVEHGFDPADIDV
jgi:hypothetical protein